MKLFAEKGSEEQRRGDVKFLLKKFEGSDSAKNDLFE